MERNYKTWCRNAVWDRITYSSFGHLHKFLNDIHAKMELYYSAPAASNSILYH